MKLPLEIRELLNAAPQVTTPLSRDELPMRL